MSTNPFFRTPMRARRACRVALPALVTSGLIAGALVASSSPAQADAVVGTYAIGDTPVALTQVSDPELGVLQPSADAAQNGMFGTEVGWPLIPLHAALTRDGNIVSYGTPYNSTAQGGLDFDTWTVAAGYGTDAHRRTPTMDSYDGFCNAIVEMADGQMLMVGGNSNMRTMILNPFSGALADGPGLNMSRWYATTIRLEDGRFLVLGGVNNPDTTAYQTPDDNSKVGYTPEIGTGTGAWTLLSGASSTDVFGATENHWWYPRAFNGPDDTVVGFSDNEIWSLDPSGNGSVRRIGTLPYHPLVSGSQVMYAPGKFLVAGGGQHMNDEAAPATNQAATFDIDGDAQAAQPMHFARNWPNMTVLPTGTVWVNGGTSYGLGYDSPDESIKQSEMWDPATGQWTLQATAQRTRSYHSVSILMPSGAVFTGGSGSPGPEDNLNAEMYYPAYLFTKAADGTVKWADRPAIEDIAGSATYGGTVRLTVDGTITGASLISDAAVTHSQNTDERRIPLNITQNGNTVTATLPATAGDMPAGDYELTVVNAQGVPSTAQIITIRQGQAGLVTVATGAQKQDAPAPAAGTTTGTPTGTAEGTGTGTGTGTGGGIIGTIATPPAPSGTVLPRLDSSVGIEPTDQLGSRIARSGSSAALQTVTAESSAGRRSESSWTVRTGLASSGGVSLESVDQPGYYLAAGLAPGGPLRVLKYAPTKSFAARATFRLVRGATGQNTSLRSWADPDYWVRHVGNSLVLQHLDQSNKGRYQSTFSIRAGYSAATPVWLTAGTSIGLQPAAASDSLVSATGTRVGVQRVSTSSSWGAKDDASWIVHSTSRGVSFESRDHAGWYLATSAYGSGTLVLARNDGSSAFAARSVFRAVTGSAGTGRSFRLAAHPERYLERSGGLLVARPLAATASARTAATFTVRTGLIPRPVH